MNKIDYEKDLINRIISSMKKHGLEECAYSVFLTGSFGRGEVTYEYDGDDVRLKSDVELGIVFKNRRKAQQMINRVSAEFEEELNGMTFSKKRVARLDNFNNAIYPTKNKTLFMYDLVNGNKTIWGGDFFKNAEISLDDVDLYEAKRVVANRIGELVYTWNDKTDNKRWQAKLISAIGTAYLLCNDSYKCTYREQLEQIKAIDNDVEREIGKGFVAKYKEAYKYLRQGADDFVISYSELRHYVSNINDIFNELELKAPKVNTISRKLKYIFKCMNKAKIFFVFNVEEKLIDSLINEYIADGDNLAKIAENWFKVLY